MTVCGLGVCSWSLQPDSPGDLVQSIGNYGLVEGPISVISCCERSGVSGAMLSSVSGGCWHLDCQWHDGAGW